MGSPVTISTKNNGNIEIKKLIDEDNTFVTG